MKVTAIKSQLKREDRYSVFVEGKYTFSLSGAALLDNKLVVGQELDEAEVRQYKQLSEDDKIYNNALGYAVLRPRSVWEMEQYLQRKKRSPPLSATILNKLSNIGLLSDEAFARSWVASRRLLKPISRRRLTQELRTKRVADSIIQEVLSEEASDETAVLQALILRKRKQTRYQNNQKLLQYLAGQGFSYGDIKTALQNLDESTG